MNKYDKEIASAVIRILNSGSDNMYLFEGELSDVKKRIKAYHKFCRKLCKLADYNYYYDAVQDRIDNELQDMIDNGLYDDGPWPM